MPTAKELRAQHQGQTPAPGSNPHRPSSCGPLLSHLGWLRPCGCNLGLKVRSRRRGVHSAAVSLGAGKSTETLQVSKPQDPGHPKAFSYRKEMTQASVSLATGANQAGLLSRAQPTPKRPASRPEPCNLCQVSIITALRLPWEELLSVVPRPLGMACARARIHPPTPRN